MAIFTDEKQVITKAMSERGATDLAAKSIAERVANLLATNLYRTVQVEVCEKRMTKRGHYFAAWRYVITAATYDSERVVIVS